MQASPASRRRLRSRSRAAALAALLIASIAAGCSTRQAYDSAQGWQRNACNRIVDAIERERCVASTTTSYDDYRRQRSAPDAPAK
jgi:hypothetical protein